MGHATEVALPLHNLKGVGLWEANGEPGNIHDIHVFWPDGIIFHTEKLRISRNLSYILGATWLPCEVAS